MRHSLPAALVAVLFSVQAAAQDDEGEKEGEGGEAAAGSLADGADPVDEETSDEGRFTPKGKTGKLKAKAKKKDDDDEIEEIPRDKINVSADLLYIWGVPPDPNRQTLDGDGDVTGFGLILGGTYDLSDKFTLGLRVPYSRADFDVEWRMYDIPLEGSSNALGNPEVTGQYRIDRSPGVYFPINFSIGLPLSQGDPDPTTSNHPAAATAMVNRTLDAGSGWRDSELYYVGRVPIKVGGGYVRERVSWNFHFDTKVIAAPKIRGALERDDDLQPPPNEANVDRYEYNSLALRNVWSTGIAGNVWSGLWLGLDAWLVIDIFHELDRQSDVTKPSMFQFVTEPMLGYDLDFMKLSVSYIKPWRGVLGDLSGARLRAEFGF